MIRVIVIVLALWVNVTYAQRITVHNSTWDCGGYSPQKARIVMHNGERSVYFDWEQNGESSWKTWEEAKAYWKEEETRILKRRKRKK